MRQRKTTIISVACGVTCALCMLLFMQSVQGEADQARAEVLAKYGGDQVEVYVATRDVGAGERIDSNAVTVKSWVADLLPAEAIDAQGKVVGRTATSPIYAGEVVSEKCFAETGAEIDVPNGMTAISVPAKPVQAVGGALQPSERVDVYAAGSASTKAIVKGALVLAASGSAGSSSSAWITLAIENKLVEQVVAAVNGTELYFSLPSPDESEGAHDAASEGGR